MSPRPMTPLAELTLMFWSAARIHRSDRDQSRVKPTLWHVAQNSTGLLQQRAETILKEILNGNPSH